MLPRERVIATIRHGRPDRMPVYGWVGANLGDEITKAYGSLAAFEDRYEFDYAHLFGSPSTYNWDDLKRRFPDGGPTPADLLDVPLLPADRREDYGAIVEGIRHHRDQRGRFAYVQTPGIFEALNGVFGIENHLAYMLLYPEEIAEVYRRQSAWNLAFAMNCVDLGVDMVHVSDDWGGQTGLLFSPQLWRDLIYPNHKPVCDAVRRRGAFLSLHSDGNIASVLDGIVELGYQVVHPYQESAGMDWEVYRRRYMGRFTVMGGLDVQRTIGFGNLPQLERDIRRVIGLFPDGGLLFCTSHFVQAHCTIEELTFAYDLVYRLVRGQ